MVRAKNLTEFHSNEQSPAVRAEHTATSLLFPALLAYISVLHVRLSFSGSIRGFVRSVCWLYRRELLSTVLLGLVSACVR